MGGARRPSLFISGEKMSKESLSVCSDDKHQVCSCRLRAEEEQRRLQEARERQERAAQQAEEERARREEERRNREDEERRQKERRWKDMQDQLDREVRLHFYIPGS